MAVDITARSPVSSQSPRLPSLLDPVPLTKQGSGRVLGREDYQCTRGTTASPCTRGLKEAIRNLEAALAILTG